MKKTATKLLPACCLLPITLFGAPDAELEDEWDTVRCINSRVVRGTDVIDDRNIVFRMSGSKIYLNTLRSACKGLSRERRFSYVVHTRSLCSRDHIRILEDSGFGLREGRVCRLGRFRLVTEEDLEFWIRSQRKEPEPEPVAPPSIEKVGDSNEENDEQDNGNVGDRQGDGEVDGAIHDD